MVDLAQVFKSRGTGIFPAVRFAARVTAETPLPVIGPGIGPESFLVGQEVADAFSAAGFPMEQIQKDCGPKAPTAHNPMAGGLHIDLWRANEWLLEQSGVQSQNIQVSGICTYKENDRFFSARREGTKCGRIINVIKLEK